jgi:sarcosine oxidase delta subunit
MTFSDFYPTGPWRKIGRKESERHWNASVKTEQDLVDIQRARDNYASDLASNRWKHAMHAKTWFNNWRDYLDEEFEARGDDKEPYGQSESKADRLIREQKEEGDALRESLCRSVGNGTRAQDPERAGRSLFTNLIGSDGEPD